MKLRTAAISLLVFVVVFQIALSIFVLSVGTAKKPIPNGCIHAPTVRFP